MMTQLEACRWLATPKALAMTDAEAFDWLLARVADKEAFAATWRNGGGTRAGYIKRHDAGILASDNLNGAAQRVALAKAKAGEI